MRNHYDLNRRTDLPRPAPEPEEEAFDLNRQKFPLWITVFISALLLGIGTAAYAVTAFDSSPSPRGDTLLTNAAGDRISGETTGMNGGFAHEEGEKADTPPVWEDSPADPKPVNRESDKPSDTQRPQRLKESTKRKTGGKKNNFPSHRPPSLPGTLGEKVEARKPASTPSVPKDFSAAPPSLDEGDWKNPSAIPRNLRVIEGHPFWKASRIGKAPAGNGHFDEVSLFGYELRPDGSVNSATMTGEKEDIEEVRSARRAGVTVVPIITGDFVSLHDLLADPEKRTRTADNLVKWAADRNFDGIDIFFGSIDRAARDNLSLFIEELAEKLHKEKKRLVIYIHPEMTTSFEDWNQWAQAVDQWRMVVCHPGGKFSEPEEFSKLINRHLTPLKNELPEEKVHLILPLSGNTGSSGESPFLPRDSSQAAGDETGTEEDLLLENLQALIRNLLTNHTDIGGIHLWYPGDSEDPKIREMIRHLKRNPGSSAPFPSQSFLKESCGCRKIEGRSSFCPATFPFSFFNAG